MGGWRGDEPKADRADFIIERGVGELVLRVRRRDGTYGRVIARHGRRSLLERVQARCREQLAAGDPFVEDLVDVAAGKLRGPAA